MTTLLKEKEQWRCKSCGCLFVEESGKVTYCDKCSEAIRKYFFEPFREAGLYQKKS